MSNFRRYLIRMALVLVFVTSITALAMYTLKAMLHLPVNWTMAWTFWGILVALVGGMLTWDTFHETFEYWWFCLWYHDEDD